VKLKKKKKKYKTKPQIVASSTKHYQKEGEHRMVLGKEKRSLFTYQRPNTVWPFARQKNQRKTIHGN